jgi:bis(5'-nucleosidyl)-tetraphosphatase
MAKAIKYEKSCGIIVVNQDRVLLLHYPSGHWDFPKGHVDGEEQEEETARRELFEETGIKDIIFIDGFRFATSYHYRRGRHIYHKKVVYFLGKTSVNDVTISHEHQGFQWCHWRDCMETLTFINSKSILSEAEKFLNPDDDDDA